MENTPKSWIKLVRKKLPPDASTYSIGSSVQVLIDETFEKIEHVPGLKTSLFPHQKPIIKAMVDLERVRTVKLLKDCDSVHLYDFDVTTTAGVLSEAVGSGKTVDVLSLILLQKYPKVSPDISNLDLCPATKRTKAQAASVVRRKFHKIMRPTLVFAGVSVVNQWVNAVETFTTLKCFAVYDVRGLQKLVDMMISKEINKYDIVVVKNGKITRPIKFPSSIHIELKNCGKSTMFIYNIISNMRSFCWARVVIDDFDTISLPHNAGIVSSLFTWYISSTRKAMSRKTNTNKEFKTTADMLMYDNYSCGGIMDNNILFYNLNIRNCPYFVQMTSRIDSPKFFAYVFSNPNNQYMGFLGSLGSTQAIEIMEMLNGDAIETAAEQLGIKTTKVADIFELMLGKEFERYTKSVNVLDFIKHCHTTRDERRPISENPDVDDTYKKSDLFIKRIIEYKYPNVNALLDTTTEEYTENRKSSSVAIERVKSNIKEGECPICSSDLNDDDEEIIILKCCGIILCGMCCFGTVFLSGCTVGNCSNCRKVIQFSDLIYLSSGFDLNKIVDEDIDEVDEDIDEVDEDIEEVKEEAPRTKMTAILEIIKGVIPLERKEVDVSISNLMKGTHVMPEASYNKVLIFANYDETIENIKTSLAAENIDFWKLGGSHKQITTTVDTFTQCKKTCVMIINSTKHCAGLNLQTATDLVFVHKIIDPNIETQVIGRGQRLGRTSQLRVHFMMYQNEFDWMVVRNTIRVIS
jgi:SNF2 family DNA or RNA helicase